MTILSHSDVVPPALWRAPIARIGGLDIATLDRSEAADLMIALARAPRRPEGPFYFTSANGEVIARAHFDPDVAVLFTAADQILADGQPLVLASRWLCRNPLPERVATTDLFHDVARRAERAGVSFYLMGATEAENAKAVAAVRAAYPRLRIVGHCHGYFEGRELAEKLAEIDALAPDILWLGLGVPREQVFVLKHRAELANVGLVKTAGGLFNHLSGTNPRAPLWMQRGGLEWLWRMLIEPRRLLWRYVTTNPLALYVLLRHSE